MKTIDLVFRTVGERTSDIALELAIRHIQPNQVHVLENIRPFSATVQQMLQIDYDCDVVVFMDADCLIMEDMTSFLQHNGFAYVDCYVLDKFRGQIHQGVHITRIDVVREMQRVPTPENDPKYVLRPESRLRSIALSSLKLSKHFKHFRIFHDYFQTYHDIFCKIALRELRSRTHHTTIQLAAAETYWRSQSQDPEFQVALHAVQYARQAIALDASPQELADFIAMLPTLAQEQLPRLALPEQCPLTYAEVEAKAKHQWNWQLIRSVSSSLQPSAPQRKVFGIGLSRTGTKSLTSALYTLGIRAVHYPDDETTLRELTEGHGNFSLLKDYDGITDITAVPYYVQLDRLFPHSKFILTVRDPQDWLQSMNAHWSDRPAFCDTDEGVPRKDTHMKIRRFLRAAVYGCYEFNADRLTYVYESHLKAVLDYFQHRPQDLLVLDICGGQGWEALCPFLGYPTITYPFPYTKKQAVLRALVG